MTTDDARVIPGGPAAVHDLGLVVLRKASVSAQDNNAYLLTAGGEQLLVDAADDADRLLALVAEGGGPLTAVVTTHRHWDHHRALAEVVAATGAAVLAGSDDADALPVPVDRRLQHGDTVRLGDVALDVICLRGHTPGSVALALTEPADGPHPGRVHLLTGDSLFPGGPGRTTSPEDFTSLMYDLEARVFGRFPDDTVVYPGHGTDTTLGTERPQIAAWRARGW
ncbi:MBL fold metallo-hydrolase [Georgenia sp. TF02-10]|uniref:MBL fold metallo-hydrolase n=1 Tax=Georgenia sp. TF02-10 TaxID=2917725 RepID=UPI001FA76DCC|nr:MBL fold metallo-hydrolase [Georgenia sp. TF02-10]UNX56180.1 MBL fold metallo-hydrolase [Georgenia sp. TF02-10]